MNYDIVVIGGGPAGLSAAIQARTRNKSVLVASGDRRDSPLYKAERIDNYLGLPGRSGEELLEQYDQHALALGVARKSGRVLNIMPLENKFYIGIGSDAVEARAVILATGVARGQKYPGEEAHLGAGVSYCATCDGMLYRGKEVAVVGRSADAPGEANYLKEIGCRVTYVSAQEPRGLDPAIPFRKAAKLEVIGGRRVSGLLVDGKELPCSGVFILRATIALADLLPGLTLEGGYVAVDRNQATNLPGVFAAGDCTGLPLQISKAVGEGQVAGHRAAEWIDKLQHSLERK